MSIAKIIEEELKCEVYSFDECNSSFCVNSDSNNEQKMYRELISITKALEKFNIDYKVSEDYTISLI